MNFKQLISAIISIGILAILVTGMIDIIQRGDYDMLDKIFICMFGATLLQLLRE